MAEDGHSYTFRLRAADRMGNVGTCDETAATTAYATTKYYQFGGKTVASRQIGGETSRVTWFVTDQLGLINLVVDQNGAVVSEMRYRPCGELRWQSTGGVRGTDFGYTGQRAEDTGLMDYKARFYSRSALGCFTQSNQNEFNDQLIGNHLIWK